MLAVLAWWQRQAAAGGSGGIAFASLGDIARAAGEQIANGALQTDAVATLSHALIGLAIGATLGLATGIAMALSAWAERLLGPLLQALRQVPMIGWLPLIALWFGTGEQSQIIVVVMAAFFPAMLNAHAGVGQVEKRLIEVGHVFGLTWGQRLRLILLPAALPMLLTGLTQALAFAWIAAIGTEILMGSGAGLGVTLQVAQTQQRLDLVFVSVAATAVLGFLLNHSIRRLRAWLLHWQPAGI